MGVAFDVGSLLAIGFTVAVATGALLRRIHWSPARMLGLASVLTSVCVLQLLPPAFAADTGPTPATGAPTETSGAAPPPTTVALPATTTAASAPPTPVTTDPPLPPSGPASDNKVAPAAAGPAADLVADFIATGDGNAKSAHQAGSEFDAATLCNTDIVWNFKIGGRYRSATFRATYLSPHEDDITVTVSGAGGKLSSRTLKGPRDQVDIPVTLTGADSVTIRTMRPKDGDCPDVIVRWKVLVVSSV